MNNVWLAEPERFEKTSKSLVYDDKGELVIDQGQLTFIGEKGTRDFGQPSEVDLIYAKFAWGNFLYTMVFTLGYIFLFKLSSTLIVILLAFNIFIFVFLWRAHKWIRINFNSDEGPKTVYISDSSGTGWKGIFGGTGKLFAKIKDSH